MTAAGYWTRTAEVAGLAVAPAADDAGVLMVYERIGIKSRHKVGLIVIRGERVTYAELDGRVMDTITSDRRPLDEQLRLALAERRRP